MSVNVLFNLSHELRKSDKMRDLSSILFLFSTSLMNSMKHEHKCQIIYYIIITAKTRRSPLRSDLKITNLDIEWMRHFWEHFSFIFTRYTRLCIAMNNVQWDVVPAEKNIMAYACAQLKFYKHLGIIGFHCTYIQTTACATLMHFASNRITVSSDTTFFHHKWWNKRLIWKILT